MKTDCFREISIRGRVAYCIKCFALYCARAFPTTDFSIVIDYAARIIDDSDYIDVSALRYMEIIPEYLYEFERYEDAEFDYLTKEDYWKFRALLPYDDTDLNTLMRRIYDIAYAYCYVGVEPGAPDTLPYILDVLTVMQKHNIMPPDVDCFSKYSFKESHGWGHTIDRSEYLY